MTALSSAKAASTMKAYGQENEQRRRWILERGLPLNEVSTVMYLAWKSESVGSGSLAKISAAYKMVNNEVSIPGAQCVAELINSKKRAEATTRKQPVCINEPVIVKIMSTLEDDAKSERDVLLVHLSYSALLRASEASNLQWKDVRVKNGLLEVFVAEAKNDQLGKGRTTFVQCKAGSDLDLLLKRWKVRCSLKNPDFIFHNLHNQKPLSPSSISSIVKAKFDAIGVQGSHHALRKGRANDLQAEGFSLDEIQRTGRWRSPAGMSTYLRDNPRAQGIRVEEMESEEEEEGPPSLTREAPIYKDDILIPHLRKCQKRKKCSLEGLILAALRHILLQGIYYPSLEQYDIVPTRSLLQGYEIFGRFVEDDRENIYPPLFVDTESSTTPRGSKLALVSHFDVHSGIVLLWRVHKASQEEVDDVIWAINQKRREERIVVFGSEPLFKIRATDIQGDRPRRPNEKMALKDAAAAIGRNISKNETLSDWTADELRRAQQHYAAMDVVILNHSTENGSVSTSIDIYSTADFRPLYCRLQTTTPNFLQHHLQKRSQQVFSIYPIDCILPLFLLPLPFSTMSSNFFFFSHPLSLSPYQWSMFAFSLLLFSSSPLL
ncbi:hypothetical protein B9Z55_009074 [Caenorhabditis nigoni]|uniref:Tyr recombinase domain-containing protein n=1 Tax=Caenorhabditis nigoni TaxID=1611254 RepID=A0A2G5UQJ9_9PELO|nr:hypothetical protein B9Z55_009074 [Caenorhabditis nigoni]